MGRLAQGIAVRNPLLEEKDGAEITAASVRVLGLKKEKLGSPRLIRSMEDIRVGESREREKFYFSEIRRLMREAREAGLFTVQ